VTAFEQQKQCECDVYKYETDDLLKDGGMNVTKHCNSKFSQNSFLFNRNSSNQLFLSEFHEASKNL
jgi:hypothetical protein